MGRRARARGRGEKLRAPESEYTSATGDVLILRGTLTPATRRRYAEVLHGHPLSREDAWQRAVEFLFERLALSWTVSDVPTTGQRALLTRLRVATPEERRFVRDALRAHVAEHFPELEAP